MFGLNFKPDSYLGIDIGTTSIKMVEVGKKGLKPELRNYGILESYGHLERLNNAIQTNSLKIAEKETAELLKILLDKANFKAKEVVSSIPAFAAFTVLLEIPQMSDSEISSTMKYQLDQHIPLPASEVEVEWIRLGQRQDDQGFVKEQILLISVPKEFIQKYTNIFNSVGLRLHSLEVESISILRSLASDDKSPMLVVDMGARSTNIVAADNGFIKYSFQTDLASANLTQALANGLGINNRRAEKLKIERGFGNGADAEISTLMIPHLDAILNEVKRAQVKYENSFGNKIEKIILTGGGSGMIGMDKYVSSQFNLPTIVGDPFSKVDYPHQLLPIVKKIGPSFSVALGLGIREFIR